MKYERKLSDLKNIEKNGYKVFSCFSCGGGSSMGYKNAGYTVIGTCEIDPQMNEVYIKNHGKGFNFLMGVQDFKNIPNDKLPKDLFDIDVLDGSPPCSTFSTSGLRERARGKEKKFREGQAKQVLSDLFFDYLDVVEKLKPKIVIAENVKGMLKGNAKGYLKMIFQRFDDLGYDVQLFCLNGATMGLPQKRERIFFCAHRKEKESFSVPTEKNSSCLNGNLHSMRNRFRSKMGKTKNESETVQFLIQSKSEGNMQNIEITDLMKQISDIDERKHSSIQIDYMTIMSATQLQRETKILFDEKTDIGTQQNGKEYEADQKIMISIEGDQNIGFECLCHLGGCIVFQKQSKNNGLI